MSYYVIIPFNPQYLPKHVPLIFSIHVADDVPETKQRKEEQHLMVYNILTFSMFLVSMESYDKGLLENINFIAPLWIELGVIVSPQFSPLVWLQPPSNKSPLLGTFRYLLLLVLGTLQLWEAPANQTKPISCKRITWDWEINEQLFIFKMWIFSDPFHNRWCVIGLMLHKIAPETKHKNGNVWSKYHVQDMYAQNPWANYQYAAWLTFCVKAY